MATDYEIVPATPSEYEVVSAAQTPMERGSSVGMGVWDPVFGLGQLAEKIPGVSKARELVGQTMGLQPKTMDEVTREREAVYQAKRAAAGESGMDWGRMAGNVINPVTWAPGMTAGKAATMAQAIKTGAGVGGSTALMQPATSEDSFVEEKGRQGVIGALTGGALNAAIKGGSNVAGFVKDEIAPYFTKKGHEVLANRYLRNIVGEANVPEVQAALKQAQPTIPARAPAAGAAGPTLPASTVTTAESVSDLAAGSPLQAQQKVTFQTPGGPSKLGGELARQAEVAQGAARADLRAATAPLREQALQEANANGGVKVNTLIKDIAKMETNPEWRASDVVSKTLANVREKLAELKDPKWRMDARDLYTVRKELGNLIERNSKDTANWDKRLSAKLQNEIQDAIDNAIESAGGTGWKDYLKQYASRAKVIEADVARKEGMYKPLQKTNLGGKGVDVSGGNIPEGPTLLWRPYTIAKWLPKMRADVIEPRVDEYMARVMADPQLAAQALNKPAPSRYESIIQALMQQGPAAAGMATVRGQ